MQTEDASKLWYRDPTGDQAASRVDRERSPQSKTPRVRDTTYAAGRRKRLERMDAYLAEGRTAWQ